MGDNGYTGEDLSGKRFGRLVAIKRIRREDNYKWAWQCQCDCGNTSIVYGYSLRSGRVNSCKCLQKSIYGKTSKNWKGVGDISGQHIAQIKCKAKQENREYNLDNQYLWDLFIKQDKKCSITKLPLEFRKSVRKKTLNYQSASLDRIDSNKGYIKGNVHWVHKYINRMKMDHTLKEFIELCKLVAANN